ncbi:pyruvate dehydrogenase (acetyl-transferring) E1 component subunit alpha [Gallaecimonas sp. GXIMD4217]|uniref:pyruvate dehydrogenase (acetyl-transferring) E1 component subunit alpha n=1 Tax=Gallaecimonas sp. GXIMD4217 TaxID=3131927 RepID=UPI00311AC861
MTFTSKSTITQLQYLDEEGNVVQPLPAWADNLDLLVEFYRHMVLVRTYDKKAIALQRTGQMGTYPSHLGAEAIGIGVGAAMDVEDVYVPYYRDMPTMYMRGATMVHNMLYWGGTEQGSYFHRPDGKLSEDFPICVPIATQCTHATGVASAFKLRGEKRVAVTAIGDGGTSKGDFLEAINCAGAWQLPCIFVINNNQWAISVPRAIQCGAPTLAQKAIGAGIPGVQVDGNDIIAVYDAMLTALNRARAGKGATLIEAVSYRLSDHTTADDATRYRGSEEVNAAWKREPVKRLRNYLHNAGVWNEDKEQALQAECNAKVEEAVQQYLNHPKEPPESMMDHHFEQLVEPLASQREELIKKAMRMEGGQSHG